MNPVLIDCVCSLPYVARPKALDTVLGCFFFKNHRKKYGLSSVGSFSNSIML